MHAAKGAAGDSNIKLNKDLLMAIAIYVDDIQSKGEYVVSNGVKFHLLHNFGIDVHRKTCGRAMKRIGLNWCHVKKHQERMPLIKFTQSKSF